MASPSAWTAKAHGVTMSLSSDFGGRSNTRRNISEPTTRCPKPGPHSADTSAPPNAEDHIRALTGGRPIRPTSPRCRMSRRLNHGRRSTYQTEEAVQTSGASSPAPTDADPMGEWYSFERGATKTTGGEGWAD